MYKKTRMVIGNIAEDTIYLKCKNMSKALNFPNPELDPKRSSEVVGINLFFTY